MPTRLLAKPRLRVAPAVALVVVTCLTPVPVVVLLTAKLRTTVEESSSPAV